MEKLNEKATLIFKELVKRADDNGGYVKIDNSNGTYMAVSVQHLIGKTYSVAHYYTQNGDAIPDPDMTFTITDDGVIVGEYRDTFGTQDGDAYFANKWMVNIKNQQGIKIEKPKKTTTTYRIYDEKVKVVIKAEVETGSNLDYFADNAKVKIEGLKNKAIYFSTFEELTKKHTGKYNLYIGSMKL